MLAQSKNSWQSRLNLNAERTFFSLLPNTHLGGMIFAAINHSNFTNESIIVWTSKTKFLLSNLNSSSFTGIGMRMGDGKEVMISK